MTQNGEEIKKVIFFSERANPIPVPERISGQGPDCGGEISGQKEKSFYMVDREFCEKLVALLNHSTNPLMDIFRVDKKVKRRIVKDYDPQAPKIKFTYYEDINDSTRNQEELNENMLWAFEQDKRTGLVTVIPLNGDRLVIHEKQEAEMFAHSLIQCFQSQS